MINTKLLSGMLTASLLAIGAQAQTPLYQWNFNSGNGVNTGSGPGGALSPVIRTTGGFSFGAGHSGQGLVDAGIYGDANAASYGGSIGNPGSLSSFTVSMWVNLNSTFVTSAAGGAVNSRLINLASTGAGDGDLLYFALNSGTNLQFGINTASTGPLTSNGAFSFFNNNPAAMATNWIFIAASYSGTSVSLYTGTDTVPASLVQTLAVTGGGPTLGATSFVSIGSRLSNGSRALPATIDDVNIFGSAFDANGILQLQGVPEPGSLALLGLGALMALKIRRNRS